jgi:hypothetical protein
MAPVHLETLERALREVGVSVVGPSMTAAPRSLRCSLALTAVPESVTPAHDDHTLWSSIANLVQLRYIVRTYDNPVPQLIELGHMDFSAPGPREAALPHNAFAPLAV